MHAFFRWRPETFFSVTSPHEESFALSLAGILVKRTFSLPTISAMCAYSMAHHPNSSGSRCSTTNFIMWGYGKAFLIIMLASGSRQLGAFPKGALGGKEPGQCGPTN